MGRNRHASCLKPAESCCNFVIVMSNTGLNIRIWACQALLGMGLVANAQVNNTGSLYNAGNMLVSGFNANNGSLNNTGTLAVGGDLTNNGSTGYNGGTLVLNGSVSQTIQGSNTFSTSAVTFGNAAGVTLDKCLSVGATATFNNGLVATPTGNTEPLEFAAGATSTGTSHSSHVNGYVRKMGTGSFIYPVGDASRYQPVDVNLSVNTAGMTVKYMPADAGSAPFSSTGTDPLLLTYYNPLEYWDINPVSAATGNVTVYWDGYKNSGVNTPSDLKTAHKWNGTWLDEGTVAAGTVITGTVTSNPVSAWGPFTLGSLNPNSTLPVSLLSFGAEVNECKTVMLSWRTAMEISLLQYELQLSTDASHFISIGSVAPKGNYSTYDYAYTPSSKSILYFRLKMRSTDGTTEYSPIVDANITCKEHSAKVYPSVTSNLVTIEPANESELQCNVYDQNGTLVMEKAVSGNTQVSFSDLSNGLYSLMLTDNSGQKEFFKIIKNN